MHRIFIPPLWRDLTRGQAVLEAAGASVLEVLDDLDGRFPGFKQQVCDQQKLKPGLAIVVNHSATALGVLQPLPADVELHFLPAIGGG